MNYNIATILAVIAILFVLLTYVTGAPLVPVAVILLGLAIIFGDTHCVIEIPNKRKEMMTFFSFVKSLVNCETLGHTR